MTQEIKTKKEIVTAYAKRFNTTKKEAENTLMKVMTFVTEELVQGNSLKLVGFLELGTKVRSAKVVRSIHTGELTETPAKRVPYCKFGKTLKNKIME